MYTQRSRVSSFVWKVPFVPVHSGLLNYCQWLSGAYLSLLFLYVSCTSLGTAVIPLTVLVCPVWDMASRVPNTAKRYCCLHFSRKTFSFPILAAWVPKAPLQIQSFTVRCVWFFHYGCFSYHLLSDYFGQHFEKHLNTILALLQMGIMRLNHFLMV